MTVFFHHHPGLDPTIAAFLDGGQDQRAGPPGVTNRRQIA
jgi:hypothetical protein